MLSFEEARERVVKGIRPLGSEYVGLREALGRVIAIDIESTENIPPFDNSAMDGFAVRHNDIKGASREKSPVLDVIGDIQAGYVCDKSIHKGEALRIMTGAPLPKGADCVVKKEDTKRGEAGRGKREWKLLDRVKILNDPGRGANIRRSGEDVRSGEVVFKKGKKLSPADIGMLASLGWPRVRVFRRPEIAILATGDELVGVGEKLKKAGIRESNSYSLGALVAQAGCRPLILGVARDIKKEILEKVKVGLDSDILLITGGVSVGKYDFVKEAILRAGVEREFWKIKMKPGRPLMYGRYKANGSKRTSLVFGLPGNPVSSMVIFEMFVRPVILKMLGRSPVFRPKIRVILDENRRHKRGITELLRAVVEYRDSRFYARTTGPQGSGILKSMVRANAILIIPEEAVEFKKGDEVDAIPLGSWLG